jgi:tRNA (guanine-N7-)-methyltransferase
MKGASHAGLAGAEEPGEPRAHRRSDLRLPSDLWRRLFGNDHPVAVEIGPGTGEFLFAAARAEPDVNFFAVERSPARAARLQERIEASGGANVRVVQADAACVLELLPDAAVSRYHVQFPDPWWKKRHARRRIWTPSFVAALSRTLRPGGTIELVTDVADYFAYAENLLAAEPGLAPLDCLPTDRMATSFARKAAARGVTIRRCLYRSAGARPERG